jgi:hypothetical protein
VLAWLTAAVGTLVPQTRKINGKALTDDVTLTASDIAYSSARPNVDNVGEELTALNADLENKADAFSSKTLSWKKVVATAAVSYADAITYSITQYGYVKFVGYFSVPDTPAGSELFSAPEGFRPSRTITASLIPVNGGASHYLYMMSDGTVRSNSALTQGAYSISGLDYQAEK